MLKQKLTQREFSKKKKKKKKKKKPQKKKKKKKKKKPSKQEVQENSYAKEQSLQSCICNFIEITPPHWCSPINLWDTQTFLRRTTLEGLCQPSISQNVETRFCQKKAI